jgi:protoporphyrinogen oxidase
VREIAIVGSGLTGLVAAWRLAAAGERVTVFERYPRPGGLVATFDAGGEPLECFYHHIFTTDTDYVALAGELGLAGEIEWLPSRMGICSEGRLWEFGTPASLLRFAPLSWPDKVRFALSSLYLSRAGTLAAMEGVSARDWLSRHAGRAAYDAVWGPLLAQKFAERAGDVSMAWLWYKLRLRGRSRSRAGLGERLGYMRGSFGRLVDALAARAAAAGVRLELATPVRAIRPVAGGVEVATRAGASTFAAALFTAAPAELLRVAGDHLPDDYRGRLAGVDHTNAVCGVLELDRPLTGFYWLNVAEEAFPFGGVIEHTNFVPPARYGGRHLVYLSKYVLPDHPLWSTPDAAVWDVMLPWLPRLNPAFDPAWIRARHVFRAANGQPIIPLHYSRSIPPFATAVPGLFHACMAQVYPEDRGQSYAVRAGNRAAAALLESVADAARV